MKIPRILAVIPARAGSKGIPGKNTKRLNDQPLFLHTLAFARLFLPDHQICLTTNDPLVLAIAREKGYTAPFIRPEELSLDTTSTFDVLHHVQNCYQDLGQTYDGVLLLQPTSPFRLKRHGEEFIQKIASDPDSVHVSVVAVKHHPWFTLFREDEGKLVKFIDSPTITRRQDCPPAVALNGSLYWFPWPELRNAQNLADFSTIKPYEMSDLFATDLDLPRDWAYAEWLFETYQDEMRDW